MFWAPVPFGVFACEGVEWFGDGCEAFDKSTIKVAKTQKGANVLDSVWCRPVPDRRNFDRVHACHPLFKDYPQVIDTQGVEDALFQLEV